MSERWDRLAKGGFTNLQLRVMSGIVLAIVALAVTWTGGSTFRMFAALVGGAMLREWIVMGRSDHDTIPVSAAVLGGTAVFVALVLGAGGLVLIGVGIAATIVTAIAGWAAGKGGWMALGVAYSSVSGIALALVRGVGDPGLVAALYLFAVVWGTDILAYFVGRRMGGPKLAPAISPGKTWSGAIGGAAGGTLAAVLVLWIASVDEIVALGVAALALSAISQAGDLFESWVKRRCGAKDSGRLIPGHGGVMDRVDGLVAAAVGLYLIAMLMGGAMDSPSDLFASARV